MGDISIANVSIDSEVFVARTENNSMYTTSKDIAEKFGKRHDHVLRDIKKLATQNGGAKSLFHETTYENRGKQYPMYLVTRDGFTLLAMGFTGADALEWKMKYISAFNRMSEIIRNELNQLKKQMPQRGTKEFLSLALLDAQQIIEEQERKLIDAQSAIAFHHAVAVTEDTILIREFAKLLTQALRKEGYKGNYKPNAEYTLYKNRMTGYRNIRIWCYLDQGNGRIQELFVTDKENNIVDMDKTIIRVRDSKNEKES